MNLSKHDDTNINQDILKSVTSKYISGVVSSVSCKGSGVPRGYN